MHESFLRNFELGHVLKLFLWTNVPTKGQLILKCLFGVFNSSKKRNKVWFSIKVTTLNSNILMVYISENILFPYLHFTWLYGSWNLQRILKKHLFWKYDGWFSSEVSKPTLVKYPWNHTFSGMTKIDFHQYCTIRFISLTKCSHYGL